MENQLILGVGAILLAIVATIALLRIRNLSRKQDTAMKLMRQNVKVSKQQNDLLRETNQLLKDLLARAGGATAAASKPEEE